MPTQREVDEMVARMRAEARGLIAQRESNAKVIAALREALENARRDIFLNAPKRGSRSSLRKTAEDAASRIEVALAASYEQTDGERK